MPTRIAEIPKSSMLDRNLFPDGKAPNMECDDTGLYFKPELTDGTKVQGLAYHTYQPAESVDMIWNSVRMQLTRYADVADNDFELLISLLGINDKGQIHLIGEQLIDTCPETETTEYISFDLINSACKPSFHKEFGTAVSNKIQVNLPYRAEWFETITLNRNWITGWSKRKKIPITGGSDNNQSGYVLLVGVTYDSDMQADFDDIRFTDQDGKTELDHWLLKKTDSTSAVFAVEIPETPINTAVKNIYAYYGNASAVSASNGANTYLVFDDFASSTLNARWTKSEPAGSITASSGSLQFSIGAGVNADWGGGASPHNAPIIYMDEPSYDYQAMVNLNSYTVNDNTHVGIMLYADRDNAIFWGHQKASGVSTIQMNKIVGNTLSSVGSWAVTSLPLSFRIRNSGNDYWLAYSTNGGETYTDLVATNISGIGFTPTKIGLFAKNWGSYNAITATFDNFRIANYTNNPPTVGSFGSEESTITISPDSYTDNDLNILFSTPADWSADSYSYLASKEYNKLNLNSRATPVSNQNVLRLGYGGLDTFNALRLKIEPNCDSDYHFTINEIRYSYEI